MADGNDSKPDLYVVNADGGGLARLTDTPARDYTPTWSPDSRRLAFTSSENGSGELWVMNADGSGNARVTPDSGFGGVSDTEPNWDPKSGSGASGLAATSGSRTTGKRAAMRLSLHCLRRQRILKQHGIRVQLGTATKATVSASARVRLRPGRLVRLRRASASIEPGRRARLRLRLRAGQRKKFRAAFRKRSRLRARVKIVAVDGAGGRRTLTRRVTVVP